MFEPSMTHLNSFHVAVVTTSNLLLPNFCIIYLFPLPPPLPLSYPPAHPLPGRRLERSQAQLNHGLLYLK